MVHKILNSRVIRQALWTLGACIACLAGAAQAQGTPTFAMPQVQAESLAEVKITMPQGLPAERTLVMIGFEFDHQKVMDEWLDKMNLRPTQRPWLQLQLHGIGAGYSWLSGFINSRKRPYFPDAYQRERVVPVYTNVKAFITAMGLPEDTKTVYLLVVQRDGKVLATAQGRYDASAAQALLATLDATN
jgi:hypothetical protein